MRGLERVLPLLATNPLLHPPIGALAPLVETSEVIVVVESLVVLRDDLSNDR